MNRLLALLVAVLAAPSFAQTPAPDLTVAVVENAPVKSIAGLKDLKGKVVYLEFWATWCEPCVQAIPSVNRLVDAMKGEPVVFLAVTDEDPAAVEAFRKTHEIRAWIGVDRDQAAVRAWHASSRPAGFLIGKDGTLLMSVRPEDLKEQDLREALAGRFVPRPLRWDDGPVPSAADAAGGETYLEARVGAASGESGMESGPDGVAGHAVPFADAVAWVWGTDARQVIVSSPPAAAFDFLLKAPPSRLAEGRAVLQGAVQAAFGVQVVAEMREADARTLTLAPEKGAPRPTPAPPGGKVGLTRFGGGRLLGTAPMARVASALRMMLGVPVFDETGLTGAYAFDLEWPRADRKALEALLAKQGLVLTPVRRRVEFLVVTRTPPAPRAVDRDR